MAYQTVVPSFKAAAMQEELEEIGGELYTQMCEMIGQKELESFVKTARIINEKLSS